MWLREVTRIEERADTPPEEEQDRLLRLQRRSGAEGAA
jgi:hypothetical protein